MTVQAPAALTVAQYRRRLVAELGLQLADAALATLHVAQTADLPLAERYKLLALASRMTSTSIDLHRHR